MHIVNKISSLLNTKPEKSSNLFFEFYPLPFDKYITIYNETSVPSNDYDYFNDVIDDIEPYLEKHNIKIIQIMNSSNDKRIKNCFYLDKFSYSQLNYIIKNSLAHICSDAYSNEIAGILDIPLILIIGNRFPKSSKAWYSKNPNSVILNELLFKKPTFSLQEFPKSINKIKTEDISEKILNALGMKFENKYSTLFIGSKYHEHPECDFIPNFRLLDKVFSKFNLNIRLDKFYNEENCFPFCFDFEHIIHTNRGVSNKFLSSIKNKCKKIIYYINNNSNTNDVKLIINSGINIELIYEDGKFDEALAFKFLDFGKINTKEYEVQGINYNTFNDKIFGTSKLILSNNKKYASYAHIEKQIEMSTINKCINSPLFWQDDCRYKIIGENND